MMDGDASGYSYKAKHANSGRDHDPGKRKALAVAVGSEGHSCKHPKDLLVRCAIPNTWYSGRIENDRHKGVDYKYRNDTVQTSRNVH